MTEASERMEQTTIRDLRLQAYDFPKLSPETAKAHAKRAESARLQEIIARREQQRLNQVSLLARSEVPARLIKNLNDLEEGEEWGVRLAMLHQKLGTGFLFGLIGTNGTGKSQMGVALIDRAINNGFTCRFIHAPELMDSIKDVYRADDGGTVQAQLNQFYSPKLLVIDEVNTSSMSEADVRYLHRIVCKRYDDCTDTLLISNDKKADFQKLVGDRVVSRMIETGGIIETTWPSYRKRPT